MRKVSARNRGIRIRPLRFADCAAARRFCQPIFPEARREFNFAGWLSRGKGKRKTLGYLALCNRRIAGLILCSLTRVDFLNRPSRRQARFEIIAVHRRFRRRGLATALWRRMESRLKGMGIRKVSTLSRPLSYGVDILKYPAATVLLLKLGFVKMQEIYDQEADLRGLDCDTEGEEARLRKEGIEIRLAELRDKESLRNFLKGRFPYWLDVPHAIKEKGDRNVHLAFKGRKLIAFSASYGSGFGPIGVNPRYRWKGLGKVLLLRCLKDVKRRGHRKVFIGWANYPFYAKAISSPITRMLWQMEKELTPN